MYGPPYICPTCQSKYRTIRGMVYPNGSLAAGHQCSDDWHSLPTRWELTGDDKQFLKDFHISQT